MVSLGVWQSPTGAIEVAVKQLQSGVTEAEKIRFLQEAAINGQFRHPNVVQLMGVVTTGEPVSQSLNASQCTVLITYNVMYIKLIPGSHIAKATVTG